MRISGPKDTKATQAAQDKVADLRARADVLLQAASDGSLDASQTLGVPQEALKHLAGSIQQAAEKALLARQG
jgi:hypothetical protein